MFNLSVSNNVVSKICNFILWKYVLYLVVMSGHYLSKLGNIFFNWLDSEYKAEVTKKLKALCFKKKKTALLF